jgi:hypothetical protein
MKKYLIVLFTLSFSLVSYSQTSDHSDTTLVELITFESESLYFRQGTPTTNCWQIGQPSKTNFSAAYSAPKAIVTDTLNAYPTNNHSWFELAIPLYAYPYFGNVGIGFYHKLQTTKNGAGGYITVSYDNGKTFSNIVNDTLDPYNSTINTYFPNVNVYTAKDTLFNGESGFSGEIMDWQYTEFSWALLILTKAHYEMDSLLVRFNFISDDANNDLDGWMIDDIHLFNNPVLGSIKGSSVQQNIEIFPNPIENSAIIQTKNQQLIQNISIYSLNGQLLKRKNVEKKDFIFEKGDLDAGFYILKCILSDNSTASLKILIK